jgi:cell division protease FtsH
VAGQEGAKEELEEIIEYLKRPERFAKLGGEVPTGVLLVGPPGTGKTLMARAVAGEAEVPFYSVSGSDFMEMFVGVGASRVRDMFEEAKKNAPAIIFVDELDSIGRQRGAGLGGGHDEREQTLNQLLSELDGFEKNESVVVMAATNRPDILDPALTRPGRFDRQITVDLPMQKARVEILKIHARNKPLADDVDLERVAQNTPGFSGADLENLLNEAALLAGRYGAEEITRDHIDEARDKVIMGLKRTGIVLSDDMKRLLAYHEGGHAINAAVLEHADPIHKVTIVPRGQAMGVTQQLPEEEKYLYRREYVLDRLAVIMGGRAAEELIFDTATSGAENDLKQVRQMARKMVLDWGMGENFRHVALGEDQGSVFLGEELSKGRDYSDATAREVDEEVRRITEDAFQRAHDTLEANRDALDRLAELLIEQEEVPGEKVVELLGDAAHGNEALHEEEGEDEAGDEEAHAESNGEARHDEEARGDEPHASNGHAYEEAHDEEADDGRASTSHQDAS